MIIELSKEEQGKVVGGWGPPGAVFGGFVSAAGYLGHAATSGSFSAYGFLESVVSGAAVGFVTGPAGSAVRAYFAPRVAASIGATFGMGDPRSKFIN